MLERAANSRADSPGKQAWRIINNGGDGFYSRAYVCTECWAPSLSGHNHPVVELNKLWHHEPPSAVYKPVWPLRLRPPISTLMLVQLACFLLISYFSQNLFSNADW